MPDSNNSFSRGSEWRKCDLHIHTPASSGAYGDAKNKQIWDSFIEDLENCYEPGSILGICDYNTFDGYMKIKRDYPEFSKKYTLLPVIELRTDDYVGKVGSLKINLHVIFSDGVSNDDLNTFLDAPLTKDKIKIKDITDRDTKPICIETLFNFFKEHVQYYKDKYLLMLGKNETEEIDASIRSLYMQNVQFMCSASETVDTAKKNKENTVLYYGQYGIKYLHCSDAHNYSNISTEDTRKIGHCFTWVKGKNCFETLRQAYFSYDSRIRISKDKPATALSCFSCVNIDMPENSKIDSETHCFANSHIKLPLNPGLNCLIGGRGTGKSLLLAMVSHKNNSLYGMSDVLRKIVPTNWKDYIRVDDIPFEYFGQGSIEELYKDKENFNATVMDRLQRYWENRTYNTHEPAVQGINVVDTENCKISYQEEINEEKAPLQKLLDEINKNIQTLTVCVQNDIQVKKLETELSNKKKIIDAFDDDNYKKMREDLNNINRKVRFIDDSKEKLESLLTALGGVFDSQQLIMLDETNSDVSRYAEQYNNIIKLWYKLESRLNKDKDVEFEILEKQFRTELISCKEKLGKYFKDKGLDDVSVADATKAHTEFVALQEQINELNKFNTDSIIGFNDITKSVEAAGLRYEKKLKEIINRTNEELSNDTNNEKKLLSFDIVYDKEKALAEFCKFLKNSMNINPDEFHSLIKRNKQEIDLFSRQMKELCENNNDLSTARKILDFFNCNDKNMQIYDLHVLLSKNNWIEYAKFLLKYKGKDLNELSFGQRATAVVIMLLLFDNKPIIIDEPETHLDQRFIANELVDIIKQVKQNRQIIFATHNANIVVGADAEQIYVLKTDESTKLTSFEQMSIEDVYEKNKQAELMCLEGSKEAFQNREKKYSL